MGATDHGRLYDAAFAHYELRFCQNKARPISLFGASSETILLLLAHGDIISNIRQQEILLLYELKLFLSDYMVLQRGGWLGDELHPGRRVWRALFA